MLISSDKFVNESHELRELIISSKSKFNRDILEDLVYDKVKNITRLYTYEECSIFNDEKKLREIAKVLVRYAEHLDKNQFDVVISGIRSAVDITLYCHPAFSKKQMEISLSALLFQQVSCIYNENKGMDVEKFTKILLTEGMIQDVKLSTRVYVDEKIYSLLGLNDENSRKIGISLDQLNKVVDTYGEDSIDYLNCDPVFTSEQMREIVYALQIGFDFRDYLNPKLTSKQMHEIILSWLEGIDIKSNHSEEKIVKYIEETRKNRIEKIYNIGVIRFLAILIIRSFIYRMFPFSTDSYDLERSSYLCEKIGELLDLKLCELVSKYSLYSDETEIGYELFKNTLFIEAINNVYQDKDKLMKLLTYCISDKSVIEKLYSLMRIYYDKFVINEDYDSYSRFYDIVGYASIGKYSRLKKALGIIDT